MPARTRLFNAVRSTVGVSVALTACVASGQPAQTNQTPGVQPAAAAWGGYAVDPATPATTFGAPPATPPISTIATAPTLFADPSLQPAQATALGGDPFARPKTPAIRWPPPGGRDTAFQRVTFESGFLPAFDNDSLGITNFKTGVTFGLPFPTRDAPLLITPGYEVLFLDGPNFDDVPPRLHAATLDLSAFRLLTDRWLLNIAATVGVFADDDSFSDDDALRVTGRALGIYQWTHEWKAIVGLVYLNRAGFSVVPAVGLQYDNGVKKIDLVFPRPKIAWRLDGGGPPGLPVGGGPPTGMEQRWLYVSGEFGGNEWAVQRAGAPDVLDYSDLRVQLGYEVKRFGGLSTRYELGYAFARELEFATDGFESSLDDSLFVRAAFSY